jgi:release factor glutamine methyltransferase
VRDYEPHLALDGGADGFAIFDRLVAEAPAHLNPGGYLVVEIGTAQEAPGHERIQRISGYELAKTVHDGSGHLRVL